MDIRSNLDGLKSLLGTAAAAPSTAQPAKGGAVPGGAAFGSDQATFSNAASEVSMAAADSGVRADKVTGIQAALAAGTYNIPAFAVASKLVDSMLGDGK